MNNNYLLRIMYMLAEDATIPAEIKKDVAKRVADWIQLNGTEDSEYIKSQYNYLMRAWTYYSSN